MPDRITPDMVRAAMARNPEWRLSAGVTAKANTLEACALGFVMTTKNGRIRSWPDQVHGAASAKYGNSYRRGFVAGFDDENVYDMRILMAEPERFDQGQEDGELCRRELLNG
jgi:hypothetical protein